MATTYTVRDLLAKVGDCIDSLDYELARKFCQRALDMSPDDPQVLEASATVDLELGHLESARQPDQGASKYMYLGQLSTSLEATQFFQRGVDLLQKELQDLEASSDAASGEPEEQSRQDRILAYKHRISSGLCSMTEIYMTDCCFESDAEQRCESYMEQAVAVDPDNPEVYQTLASVRMSQQRSEEAKYALQKSLNLWQSLDKGHPSIPPFEVRLNAVRLLLEVGLNASAVTVLEGLEDEDDESVDVCYLLGWAHYIQAEEKATDVDDELQVAQECLQQARELYDKTGYDDPGIAEHITDLLESIRLRLPEQSEETSDGDGQDDNGSDAMQE